VLSSKRQRHHERFGVFVPAPGTGPHCAPAEGSRSDRLEPLAAGLRTLREYEVGWLRHDIVAGLVLTTMLVPVGIAYAAASGVPGIYGLYATIVPLLAYALFGPSRVLVLGPDSSLAAVILAVVLPLSGGDPLRAVAIAGMMAVVSGIVCILAGVARLGFVTELLSKPIRYGYMNGIALTVMISQLPKLFGFSGEGEGPLRRIWAFAQALLAGKTNGAALMIGTGTLAVILLLKGNKRVPGILVAVVGATVIVGALNLAARAGVSVLGSLPKGLPAFAIPWITYADIVPVLIGGCAVALVSFADTSVLSRTYAARTDTYVDPNQEMVGLGAANLATGFFQGFPVSSSSSRTPRGRSRRCQNPVGRSGRRIIGCAAADCGTEAAPTPAQQRVGCRRDRLSPRPDRGHRPASHLSHPAVGILAVHRLLRWRGRSGRDSGKRPGNRGCGDRIPVGWLASAFRGSGARPGC
jgi:hypothetical protein